MFRPRISPQKKKILELLVMAGDDGMKIADIIEAGNGKAKYIARILNGLVLFGMIDCDPTDKTYRARKTADGQTIERFPKGTKIEYRDGVRVVMLPPARAYGYSEQKANLISTTLYNKL